MMLVPKYRTSRDYGVLWDLAHVVSVVCVVDYRGGAQRDLSKPDPDVCRDVAHTIRDDEGYVSVSARGISYVDTICSTDSDPKANFMRGCERANLEWIVPTED